MRHTLRWFKNRVGKRIYRYTDTKCCEECDRVYREGIVVDNANHAQYLYDAQNDLELEYGDKPKQNDYGETENKTN